MAARKVRVIKRSPFQMKLKRNAPKILKTIGLAGLFAAPVLAVRSTVFAVRAVDKRKEELGVKKLPVGEIVKTSWKYYIPVVAVTGISAASTLKCDSIRSRDAAALATACTVAERTLTDFREQAVEKIGKEKTKEIEAEVEKKHFEENVKVGKMCVLNTGKGDVIFREPTFGIYFRSDFEFVNQAWAETYSKVKSYDTADLGEFLSQNGIKPGDGSDVFGWHTAMFKELVYPTYVGYRDEQYGPVWKIIYDIDPITSYLDE